MVVMMNDEEGISNNGYDDNNYNNGSDDDNDMEVIGKKKHANCKFETSDFLALFQPCKRNVNLFYVGSN